METKKISKAQMNAVAKYTKAHYDELKIRVPKGERDIIKECADSVGETLNGFVAKAISDRIRSLRGDG